MTRPSFTGRMAAGLRLFLAVLPAVFLTLASAAQAQQATEADPNAAARRPIELDEFRRLFLGKTVYFVLEDGTAWGREYYAPGSNHSVFMFTSGGCFDGHWEQVGDRYCFYYRDQPSCWLTFWEDGQINVISRDGMRQRISEIVDSEPLSCEPAVISRAQSPAGTG